MGHSDFLFARPSFIEGLARIVDFGGTLNEYNRSKTAEEADKRALKSDFEVIGRDLREAIDEFEHAAK